MASNALYEEALSRRARIIIGRRARIRRIGRNTTVIGNILGNHQLAWSAVKVCLPLNIAAKSDGAGAFCSVVWVVVKLTPPTFNMTLSLPEKT